MFESIDLGIKYVGDNGNVPVVLRIAKLGLGVWAGPLADDEEVLIKYETFVAKLSKDNHNATILFCDWWRPAEGELTSPYSKTYLYKNGNNFPSEYNEKFKKNMIEFEPHADPFGTMGQGENKLNLEFPEETQWIIVNAWDDGSNHLYDGRHVFCWSGKF